MSRIQLNSTALTVQRHEYRIGPISSRRVVALVRDAVSIGKIARRVSAAICVACTVLEAVLTVSGRRNKANWA